MITCQPPTRARFSVGVGVSGQVSQSRRCLDGRPRLVFLSRDARSSAPCRVGYLLMSVYTKKRDLPTYPEPPRGVTAPTYLPIQLAPAITTAVTSMLCRHIILLSDALFLTAPQAPEKIGCGPTLRSFFARASDSAIRRGLPSLISALSACVHRASRRPLRRSHEHSTSHW